MTGKVVATFRLRGMLRTGPKAAVKKSWYPLEEPDAFIASLQTNGLVLDYRSSFWRCLIFSIAQFLALLNL